MARNWRPLKAGDGEPAQAHLGDKYSLHSGQIHSGMVDVLCYIRQLAELMGLAWLFRLSFAGCPASG